MTEGSASFRWEGWMPAFAGMTYRSVAPAKAGAQRKRKRPFTSLDPGFRREDGVDGFCREDGIDGFRQDDKHIVAPANPAPECLYPGAGAQREQKRPVSTSAILPLLVLLLLLSPLSPAQSLEAQKAAVVKITSQSDDLRRTGTGFIVRLEKDAAFIVTASHVVEGDNRPRVEFFTRRNNAVTAEVVRIEGGDPRGLALLVVRGRDNVPQGLQALPVDSAQNLGGGEPVVVIGFPQGGGAWAVLRANVVSQEGREITLDGSIGEGNSGGPVLHDGRVIGVVTTVGGGGGFGRALPAALVRLVLEGWGVKPQAAETAARRDSAAGQAPASARETPPAEETRVDASADAQAGKGQVRVIRARCERLQSATGFRITLYGESEGPEGATVKVSLTRDGREVARPSPKCGAWKSCVRPAGGPAMTDWTVSTMIFPPVPTDATISVQDAVRGNPGSAYGQASVELGCLHL